MSEDAMAIDQFCQYSKAMIAKFDLSEDWRAIIFRAVNGGLIIRGAVCPPKAHGPNKGDPSWARREMHTDFEGLLTTDDLRIVKRGLDTTQLGGSGC